ncbi:MAG: hypothetical protein D3923_18200, partial [Candidatus Electrothrix sp. AR3]|nr:hypothetical protein [Candidatus Electrothrix sp. AR3]
MMIPFTDREMERAWRENLSASNRSVRTNALRLLLFYAVECGLKAIIMRRYGRRNCRTDYCPEIGTAQHDINKLLDTLNVNVQLRLPHKIRMRNLSASRKSKEKQYDCLCKGERWLLGFFCRPRASWQIT